ncbi:hypothetical protein [Rhodospirillaceae bacterium SYSU D60014]|jgi:hypothetical protein|uniref:hypothetical protein n=1 Tax=Virgifigura deserti TaxID=2268457 RepID=UPI000E66BFFD
MENLIYLFGATVLLASLLASISIWAPRKLWVKGSAVVTASLLLVVGYASLADLLSKPKPVNLEWVKRNVPEATVLSASIEEGQGIYLWLQIAGIAGPRSYVMPWDQETAEQLQSALEDAETNGNGVRMIAPFEPSLDTREPKFYALPQPALPPKDRDHRGPMVYEHPGTEI